MSTIAGRVLQRALVLSLSALVVGCGGDRGVSDADRPADCGGPGAPVSVKKAVRVLRQGGFTVTRVPDSASCDMFSTEEDIVAEVSNEFSGDPDSVRAREGRVFCSIYRSAIYPNEELKSDLDARPFSPIFSGRKAEWWFSNVSCTMYPGGSRPAKQIASFDATVAKLASNTD